MEDREIYPLEDKQGCIETRECIIYFIWQVVYEIACCILINRNFYISFIEKCCQEYYEDANMVLIDSKEIHKADRNQGVEILILKG